MIASTNFAWDYTTYLNIVFLLVFGVLYFLYRSRDRLGAGATHAIDPVCGMQVRRSNAPAHATVDGESFWFCSDRCRDAFTAPTQARDMSSG